MSNSSSLGEELLYVLNVEDQSYSYCSINWNEPTSALANKLILTAQFRSLLYLFGHEFLLVLRDWYVRTRQFALASRVSSCIQNHNEAVDDALPTTLEERNAKLNPTT